MSELQQLQMSLLDLIEEQKAINKRFQLIADDLVKRIARATPSKVCVKCKQEQIVEAFYRDDRYRDGRYPYCKSCKSDYYKARKAA